MSLAKKINQAKFLAITLLILVTSSVILLTTYLYSQGFFEKSRAKVYIQDSNLRIDFAVSKKDYSDFKAYFNNLNIEEDISYGISVGLDENSIKYLEKMLPQDLILKISGNKLQFSSSNSIALSSSLPAKNYEISTGSAYLKLKAVNDKNYNLEIKDPELVLGFATKSGQIKLSSEAEGMFPILHKIDTINLRVNGDNLEGTIVLKWILPN